MEATFVGFLLLMVAGCALVVLDALASLLLLATVGDSPDGDRFHHPWRQQLAAIVVVILLVAALAVVSNSVGDWFLRGGLVQSESAH
jgi:hypothetical protein